MNRLAEVADTASASARRALLAVRSVDDARLALRLSDVAAMFRLAVEVRAEGERKLARELFQEGERLLCHYRDGLLYDVQFCRFWKRVEGN